MTSKYRTRDAEAFEKGKKLVEEFVANLDFVRDDEYYVIDDPNANYSQVSMKILANFRHEQFSFTT